MYGFLLCNQEKLSAVLVSDRHQASKLLTMLLTGMNSGGSLGCVEDRPHKILHHFEAMENHCLLVVRGKSSFQGFLGGAGLRPSAVSTKKEPFLGAGKDDQPPRGKYHRSTVSSGRYIRGRYIAPRVSERRPNFEQAPMDALAPHPPEAGWGRVRDPTFLPPKTEDMWKPNLGA